MARFGQAFKSGLDSTSWLEVGKVVLFSMKLLRFCTYNMLSPPEV